jgi:hypothetical protein
MEKLYFHYWLVDYYYLTLNGIVHFTYLPLEEDDRLIHNQASCSL